MTATNMCYNFVGFRYSPPLNHYTFWLDAQVIQEKMKLIIVAIHCYALHGVR